MMNFVIYNVALKSIINLNPFALSPDGTCTICGEHFCKCQFRFKDHEFKLDDILEAFLKTCPPFPRSVCLDTQNWKDFMDMWQVGKCLIEQEDEVGKWCIENLDKKFNN